MSPLLSRVPSDARPPADGCSPLTALAGRRRDAFGLADDYPNAKLLADEYAAKGYRVLLPDVFGGDPLPASLIVRPPLGQSSSALKDGRLTGRTLLSGGQTKVPTQEELANKSFIGRLLTRMCVSSSCRAPSQLPLTDESLPSQLDHSPARNGRRAVAAPAPRLQ